MPHLFTPLPQASGKGVQADNAPSVRRVTLNADILGFPAFIVSVGDREFVAERVESQRSISSETFLYMVEGEELLSVFTKSYDGRVLGYIQAGGKNYFISDESGEYVVAPSATHDPLPEVVYYPLLEQPILPMQLFASTSMGRRRAVRSGPEPPTVWLNIAVCLDYRDAVGGSEKAIARVTHMVDRLNAAYRASGFYGRVAIREIYFIDPPVEVVELGLFKWARTLTGPVVAARERTKAAGTVVISQGSLQSSAIRTSLYPFYANGQVAIVGKFFAGSDPDIKTFIHEVGHLSGGDHNPESSSYLGRADPQASARDWYSCEEKLRGALSYNVCDRFMNKIEMFSGLKAVYAGKVRGNEMQDNAGMFAKVFEFMKGDHK